MSAALVSKHKRRPAPLSLRLSDEERERLAHAAGSMAISAYIKSKLFGESAQRIRHPRFVRDERTLAHLLARLGASGLAAHMEELAEAARSGSLYCDDETLARLNAACADISAMRSMLVEALGQKPERRPHAPASTPRRAFNPLSAPESGQ